MAYAVQQVTPSVWELTSAQNPSVAEVRRFAHDTVVNEYDASCCHLSDASTTLSVADIRSSECVLLCEEIERLTRDLFFEKTFEQESVETLDALAGHIVSRAERDRRLLDNKTLLGYVNSVYGGDTVLEEHTISALRATLGLHSLNQLYAGAPHVIEFLDDPGIHPSHLHAANAVMCDLDRYVNIVIDPTLEFTEPQGWKKQRQQLSARLGAFGHRSTAPLILYPRLTLVTKVRETIEAGVAVDDVAAETLCVALDSMSAHYMVSGRAYQGTTMHGPALGKLVYELLWEHGTYLASQSGDPRKNSEHLVERLHGRVAVTRNDVAVLCPHISGLVSAELQAAATERAVVFDERFTSIRDIVKYLTSLTGHNKKLPPMKSVLADGTLEAIEAFIGEPYSELSARLVAENGFKAQMSNNEVRCAKLLKAAFAAMEISPSIVHDTIPRMASWQNSRMRPDFAVTYTPQGHLPGMEPTEILIVEADGENHFRDVHTWSVERTRERDIAKGLLVLDAAQPGCNMRLMAFHYASLRSLTDEQMRSLIEQSHERDWGWVFVRPSGCGEMRAAPAETIEVTVPGFEDHEVFVIDRRPVS